MKYISTALLLILALTTINAQESTDGAVNRVTRRINDFDIYKIANEKKAEEKLEETPTIEEEVPVEKVEPTIDYSRVLNDGSYYSVQVAACRVPLSKEYLDYKNYVEIYGSDGWYRYFSSQFLTLEEAKIYQKEIRRTTKFKDAFPVRIKDYVKIDLLTGF